MRRRLAVLALAGLATAAACSARPQGPGPMRVVAGNGTEGFADGTGAVARFRKPIRLAALGDDSVVVADIFNHAIREVSPRRARAHDRGRARPQGLPRRSRRRGADRLASRRRGLPGRARSPSPRPRTTRSGC